MYELHCVTFFVPKSLSSVYKYLLIQSSNFKYELNLVINNSCSQRMGNYAILLILNFRTRNQILK